MTTAELAALNGRGKPAEHGASLQPTPLLHPARRRRGQALRNRGKPTNKQVKKKRRVNENEREQVKNDTAQPRSQPRRCRCICCNCRRICWSCCWSCSHCTGTFAAAAFFARLALPWRRQFSRASLRLLQYARLTAVAARFALPEARALPFVPARGNWGVEGDLDEEDEEEDADEEGGAEVEEGGCEDRARLRARLRRRRSVAADGGGGAAPEGPGAGAGGEGGEDVGEGTADAGREEQDGEEAEEEEHDDEEHDEEEHEGEEPAAPEAERDPPCGSKSTHGRTASCFWESKQRTTTRPPSRERTTYTRLPSHSVDWSPRSKRTAIG